MKNTLVCFFFLLFLLSCQREKVTISKLNKSIGERNELALVIDDSLWNGAVGDSIRKRLVIPVDNVLTKEPLFDIVQYNTKIFSYNAKLSRNIITFKKAEHNSFRLQKSVFSTPQNYFTIQYKSTNDLIEIIRNNSDSIVSVLQKSELNEEQHLISRTASNDLELIKNLFGITIKIPKYYHVVNQSEFPFLWYQKELASGDVNIIVYEYPIDFIERDSNTNNNIISAMDSIGKTFIKGRKSFTYMMNDSLNKPIITNERKDQMDKYLIKGIWSMVNDYSSGPYLCYVIRDDFYNRYLFLQGFINDPVRFKRDHLLELEAIFKTINFYENNI